MKVSDREDLQRWDDFLAAQMLAFDAAYLVKAGEPHVADPLRIAFLEVSDSLCQANVERAIDDFLVNDAWPIWLSLDELVNITHRAHFARSMLKIMLGIQKGAPAVFVAAESFKVPCATDRSVFLRWLLVDTWRINGQARGSPAWREVTWTAKARPDPRRPPDSGFLPLTATPRLSTLAPTHRKKV